MEVRIVSKALEKRLVLIQWLGKGSLLDGFGVHWEVDGGFIVLKSKRAEGGPSS